MVHALREAWRVLHPAGVLIDLRPLSTVFPIHAVAGARLERIGEGSATATLADDRASEAALGEMVAAGLLLPRHRAQFEIRYYWNSTEEMAECLRTGRAEKTVSPPYPALEAARAAASIEPPARLRAERTMTIGSYAKGPGDGRAAAAATPA